MVDKLCKLHELRYKFDEGDRKVIDEIAQVKKEIVLPPMPDLSYIPESMRQDFYRRYPAYCLGYVDTTPYIDHFLKGCKLHNDILEALKRGKEAENTIVESNENICVDMLELHHVMEYEEFVAATKHLAYSTMHCLMVSPDTECFCEGYRHNVKVARDYLLSCGWDVAHYKGGLE